MNGGVMKNFRTYIVDLIVKIYTFSFQQRVRRFENIIYTHWLKGCFAELGRDCYIERGLRLIGGENIFIGDSVCIQRLSNLSAWGSFNGEVFHPVIIIGEKKLDRRICQYLMCE